MTFATIDKDLSDNKSTGERYMEAYNRLDHDDILDCLAEDVEWLLPGAFHLHGKSEFDEQIESDCFVGPPTIVIHRLREETKS